MANLGNIGDVVQVKNGYAKNFLIPQKKAICFSDNNYKIFESKKSEYENLNSTNSEKAQKIKENLEGKNIIIIENASDDGRLFGSVNSSVIANKINDEINEKFFNKNSINLNKTIKEIGVYEVQIYLHSDIKTKIILIVSRSDSEVEQLLTNYNKKNSK